MKLVYYTICFDGIDRSGKDTIAKYIDKVSHGKYLIKVRGIMSMNVYAKKFGRDFTYEMSQQRSIINVLLNVDEDDWTIRCKLTKEHKIDYNADSQMFKEEYDNLVKMNYPCLMFNTSKTTVKDIVDAVLKYADELNEGANL